MKPKNNTRVPKVSKIIYTPIGVSCAVGVGGRRHRRRRRAVARKNAGAR